MIFVSPMPLPWHEIYKKLNWYWNCQLQKKGNPPPTPLILSGWIFSNDFDKKHSWEKTMHWASENKCLELIPILKKEEIYFVDKLSSYRPYEFLVRNEDPCLKPSDIDIKQYLEKLLQGWANILDVDFGKYTTPLKFSGKKMRRLYVLYDSGYTAPWGSWTNHLANGSPSKFTELRKKVNSIIAPHHVDYIGFTEKIKR